MPHLTRDTGEQVARALMRDFLERTTSVQRYLWTDAFAVCNLIALSQRREAIDLVKQVHAVLGRHRPDDERRGWISGLDDTAGARHPTIGGLRIGKPLPERRHDEPLDSRLEWDRDGQYFHYLVKWMHALNRMTLFTGDATYNTWAIELARTAVTRFSSAETRKRLFWKMSVDLRRPLVPSMGQHDPLDGLITCSRLAATGAHDPTAPDLGLEIATLTEMYGMTRWETDDPLGIGGLLTGACELVQLIACDAVERTSLLDAVLEAATNGLHAYASRNDLDEPPHRRLAFRELGLVIGLRAIDRMRIPATAAGLRLDAIEELAEFTHLGDAILDFWLDPAHRKCRTWLEHRDINDVMLATGLVPDGFLLADQGEFPVRPVSSNRNDSMEHDRTTEGASR